MNAFAARTCVGILVAAVLIPFAGGEAAAGSSVTWARASSGPWLIWDADAFAPTTGRLVVFGGSNYNTGIRRETHLFDPSTNAWTTLTARRTDPSARVEARMVWDPDIGRIVLFGGRDNRATLQDTWAFDPVAKTWTALVTSCRRITCPPARWGQGMVWSSALHRVLMFGGVTTGETLLNDLWAFDGKAWARISTASQPSARYLMGIAEDQATGRVLLYGGANHTLSGLADTWSLNPSAKAWTRVLTSTVPEERAEVGMAWLASLGKIVITSGSDASGCTGRTNSVWAFDSGLQDWVSVAATGTLPTPRNASALVSDPVHGTAILHGPPDWALSPEQSDYTWILR